MGFFIRDKVGFVFVQICVVGGQEKNVSFDTSSSESEEPQKKKRGACAHLYRVARASEPQEKRGLFP